VEFVNSDRRFDESVLVLKWKCGWKWNNKRGTIGFCALFVFAAAAKLNRNCGESGEHDQDEVGASAERRARF